VSILIAVKSNQMIRIQAGVFKYEWLYIQFRKYTISWTLHLWINHFKTRPCTDLLLRKVSQNMNQEK